MHDDTFPAALAGRFDAHEEQLRRAALRMTGSKAEADAALAAVRAGLGRDVEASVRAWLTALVTQECVRGRGRRRAGEGPGRRSAAGAGGGVEDTAGVRAGGESGGGGESVWLALILVLESLGDEERIAYVLHDVFGLPSYETARITGDSPEKVARPARRARERVRGRGTAHEEGIRRQRAVVDLFLAAARARDAHTLAAVLDPDVVAHSDRGPVHGAPAVAEGAAAFARFADVARPALVDGAVGAVAFVDGRPVSAVAFALRRDRIVTVSVTTGEDRVRALDLVFSDG
ncbi:sigma factor-like helix-turn-helix DNA-binding protein [Streptomyces flavochromogenes]|uniref:sigma factor-like helix-turn-helix DNA-binding protein n=1 Tax=Streptomyces flavochromogenes TaxID=68199 RepID=UPI0004C149E3|nr:sigma factor-like helix-turn-helix DNA-binding protein [Streptomyces flavochromogenes]